MTAMREAAFKIQGLPVPPRARARRAGTAADRRRAAALAGAARPARPATTSSAPRRPTGPWTAIATNVSDADIAYRPLFSDTTARAGQTWFYRVTARNASGRLAAVERRRAGRA